MRQSQNTERVFKGKQKRQQQSKNACSTDLQSAL